MASKYILQHTAEAIDHKLDLIVENKNLLEYPYDSNEGIPAEFIDVGDGSIIVPDTKTGHEAYYTRLSKSSIILPAGTYTISNTSINLLTGKTYTCEPCWIDVKKTGTGTVLARVPCANTSRTFTLSRETSVDVFFDIKAAKQVYPGILLRPQLEKGDTATAWVPYMKNIGNYVDERVNGLSTEIRALLNSTKKSITIGDTSLTEKQLIKILAFIDSIELEA
jgi:hypothetical protein